MSTKPDYTDNAFFSMPFINELIKVTSLPEAKELAMKAIQEKPNARPANVTKATAFVMKATSVTKLAQACTNFLLSHDGYKVIH